MNIDENVQKVIKLLLRKWKLLILFMLIGALLAGVYTAKFTTLTYTSSVEFLAAAVDPAHEISDSTGEVAGSTATTLTAGFLFLRYSPTPVTVPPVPTPATK